MSPISIFRFASRISLYLPQLSSFLNPHPKSGIGGGRPPVVVCPKTRDDRVSLSRMKSGDNIECSPSLRFSPNPPPIRSRGVKRDRFWIIFWGGGTQKGGQISQARKRDLCERERRVFCSRRQNLTKQVCCSRSISASICQRKNGFFRAEKRAWVAIATPIDGHNNNAHRTVEKGREKIGEVISPFIHSSSFSRNMTVSPLCAS